MRITLSVKVVLFYVSRMSVKKTATKHIVVYLSSIFSEFLAVFTDHLLLGTKIRHATQLVVMVPISQTWTPSSQSQFLKQAMTKITFLPTLEDSPFQTLFPQQEYLLEIVVVMVRYQIIAPCHPMVQYLATSLYQLTTPYRNTLVQ